MNSRLHPDTQTVAKHICACSKHGAPGSESIRPADMMNGLGMNADGMAMAVDELAENGYLRGGPETYLATALLFQDFDLAVKGWDPAADALTVARELIKNDDGAHLRDLAPTLGWEPRRLNPACVYLQELGKIEVSKALGSAPFAYPWIRPTPATKRFVRDSSA